jgi:hypothetical protein
MSNIIPVRNNQRINS